MLLIMWEIPPQALFPIIYGPNNHHRGIWVSNIINQLYRTYSLALKDNKCMSYCMRSFKVFTFEKVFQRVIKLNVWLLLTYKVYICYEYCST